eukprot:CAMPEP_0202448594 /NCGR_PEP_ID=MMETSP1360-20130828/7409_1 /ASSEMBLY_ACC=CAM_ASM_000848 /TAXON_ID=515479 /ORGANISM="Licmophora paradoxa, Strain CCMP2313" /LENGTH=114 /DNA_ID=CAMNT_0049066249 /DNA_START=8 /DNA_END=352 /DNA_ORIENTATION=-
MTETEQHYKIQAAKLKDQIRSRDTAIEKQKDEIEKIRDVASEHSMEKNQLLEESTEFRMQLENQTRTNKELTHQLKGEQQKSKPESKTPPSLPEHATNAAENKAADMHDTIEQL